jgi:hypothetical protein
MFPPDDITASRGFTDANGELSFFIKRTDAGIVLEIDNTNQNGEIALNFCISKSVLKELEIMFRAAQDEEYPNADKGFDNY